MVETVIFDVGGVLVDWDPRHLYRKVFDQRWEATTSGGLVHPESGYVTMQLPPEVVASLRCDEEMERFLAEVCTWEWHHRHDAGVPFAESIPALSDAFPEHADLIAMWESRYLEMVPGEIPGTADIVRDLHAAGNRLLVLSNMPSEVWTPLTEMFDWFSLFHGAVVSGDEKVVKPDPAIYRVLIERFDLDPPTSVFVDDRVENVEAAAALGFNAILFTDADSLRRSLDL